MNKKWQSKNIGKKMWMEIMEFSKNKSFENMVAIMLSPWGQKIAD